MNLSQTEDIKLLNKNRLLAYLTGNNSVKETTLKYTPTVNGDYTEGPFLGPLLQYSLLYCNKNLT